MQKNILVVDDEHEIADLVELYLKNEGFTVFKFETAMDPWPVCKILIWISLSLM